MVMACIISSNTCLRANPYQITYVGGVAKCPTQKKLGHFGSSLSEIAPITLPFTFLITAQIVPTNVSTVVPQITRIIAHTIPEITIQIAPDCKRESLFGQTLYYGTEHGTRSKPR